MLPWLWHRMRCACSTLWRPLYMYPRNSYRLDWFLRPTFEKRPFPKQFSSLKLVFGRLALFRLGVHIAFGPSPSCSLRRVGQRFSQFRLRYSVIHFIDWATACASLCTLVTATACHAALTEASYALGLLHNKASAIFVRVIPIVWIGFAFHS